MATKTSTRSDSATFGVLNYTDGNLTGQSNGKFTKTYSSTFTGTQNPNWRSLVRQRQDATTGASGTQRNFHYGSGQFVERHKQNPGNHIATNINYGPGLFGDRALIEDATSVPLGNADTDAKLKFLQNLRAVFRQFQGGTFFGELRETLEMVRRPAAAFRHGLDNYYSAAKKAAKIAGWGRVGAVTSNTRAYYASLNKRQARSVTRAVQDTWLEYVFGWKPLLNDVDDAMRALATENFQRLIPLQAQSRSQSTATSTGNQGGLGTARWMYDIRTETEASVRYKGACFADPGKPGGWQESLGLSLDNFLPTVWELIPYSFLVDYFTNVGDVIDGMSAPTSRIAWCVRSIRRQRREVIERLYNDQNRWNAFVSPSDQISASGFYVGYTNECTVFSRNRVYQGLDLGVSDLHFRIPGIGSTRWLNIAALSRLRSL